MSPKRKLLPIQKTKKEALKQKAKRQQTKHRIVVARRSIDDDDPDPDPDPNKNSTSTSTTTATTSTDEQLLAQLESSILELLRSRKPGTNCCPSEIPRRIKSREDDWRALMPATREAAARLMERGLVVITQKGVAIADARDFKGPIRLKLAE